MNPTVLPVRTRSLALRARPLSRGHSWAAAAAAVAVFAFGAFAAPAVSAAGTGSWTQIASMSTMRDYHAATLLADGLHPNDAGYAWMGQQLALTILGIPFLTAS